MVKKKRKERRGRNQALMGILNHWREGLGGLGGLIMHVTVDTVM